MSQKKLEERIQDMWNSFIWSNPYVIGIPEEKGRQRKEERCLDC